MQNLLMVKHERGGFISSKSQELRLLYMIFQSQQKDRVSL